MGTSARLLHITTVPETLGFLRGQIAYMRKCGYEVHAASSPGAMLTAFGERESIPVHAVAMERRITPFKDLRCLFALWRLMRRLQPDIVHAHTPKGGLLGMLAATLAGVPIRIYHIRGLPLATARGSSRWLLRWTERTSCRAARRVFCVSHSLRELVQDERLCPAEKIEVFHSGSGNGVDARKRFDPRRHEAREAVCEQLGIPSDARVVGFVGRLVRDKGVLELARAWRVLRDEYDDLRLLIVGPAEQRDAVPEECLEVLVRDERVHFTGGVHDVAPFYRAMDVVALPTYREGFPNVPLEAAAMELPVVATKVTGCLDAVADGFTGCLIPPREVAPLCAAITQYLDDPELARLHGLQGRARVLREFRPETIWAAVEQSYADLRATVRSSRKRLEAA